MNIRNQSNTSAHSVAFHEQQLALFDAYITDELDTSERGQVEQSLTSCQECNQLFTDVTHFRHALGTLPQPESLPNSENIHSAQMVQAVMASIEQREGRGNSFTADDARQAQPFPRVSSAVITTRKRIQPMSLAIGAAVLCLILLVGFLIALPPTSRNGAKTVPNFIPWTTQGQHLFVQNSSGVFALKEIEIITGKEFHFFYVFQSPGYRTIDVTAISSLNTGKEHPISLSTRVLPLGTIGNFSVGVIYVQYLNRVGQTITLNVISPSKRSVNWQLAPLKQILTDPHSTGGSFYSVHVDQQLLPAIIWSGPSGWAGLPPYSSLAFFKDKADMHYIFLLIDYSGKIEVITREKCIQVVGERGCR